MSWMIFIIHHVLLSDGMHDDKAAV